MGKNNKYAQCNYLHTDQVVAVFGAAIGKRWCDDLLKMVFTIHTHTHMPINICSHFVCTL